MGFVGTKITNHATPSKSTEAHIHAERTIPSLGSCSQLRWPGLCLCPSWSPRHANGKHWPDFYSRPPWCPPCTITKLFSMNNMTCERKSWPHKQTTAVTLIQTWVELTPKNRNLAEVLSTCLFHMVLRRFFVAFKVWGNLKIQKACYIWTPWVRASAALWVLPACLTRPSHQVLV